MVVPGWNGIYRTRGNTIEVIADPATPHPISGALFRSSAFFWHPSAGSRHVSFGATSAPAGPRGYFVVSDDGEWTVLAEEGSELEGRVVTWVGDSPDGAWDGERVAFAVDHPSSSAIYVADFGIPVPTPLEIPAAEEVGLIVFAGLLAAAGLATVSRGR